MCCLHATQNRFALGGCRGFFFSLSDNDEDDDFADSAFFFFVFCPLVGYLSTNRRLGRRTFFFVGLVGIEAALGTPGVGVDVGGFLFCCCRVCLLVLVLLDDFSSLLSG